MLGASTSTTILAVKTVSGRRIAQTGRIKYPPQERANDAAGWMVGAVKVLPTARLACEVFGVSYPTLKQARERAGQHSKRRNGSGSGTAMSDGAIELLIAKIGVERIWRALDRLTQPQLPLHQAAE